MQLREGAEQVMEKHSDAMLRPLFSPVLYVPASSASVVCTACLAVILKGAKMLNSLLESCMFQKELGSVTLGKRHVLQ